VLTRLGGRDADRAWERLERQHDIVEERDARVLDRGDPQPRVRELVGQQPPKPGMIAVQPQSRGRSERISASSTSPGCAPLTNTGPVTGFTRVKSSAATASTPESRSSWPPDASVTSNSTVAPDSTSAIGAIELSQTVWTSCSVPIGPAGTPTVVAPSGRYKCR
jgi:hypothetical protein